MKILVIEDEPKVAAFIKEGLELQNFNVTIAYDGFFGKKLALENFYDVLILDLLIPYVNGLDLCKQLRLEGYKAPILILSALSSVDDKVMGLDSGADDYMVKPFDFRELIARIKALSNRYTDNLKDHKILSMADLELDIYKKTVKRNGKMIDLTFKEFLLLEYLLKNKNRVVSRAEINEKVWGEMYDSGTNIIDVYINFLRRKVDKGYKNKLIYTMVGMGYMMRDPE
jgi:DNA-binding response OmpR family regulator